MSRPSCRRWLPLAVLALAGCVRVTLPATPDGGTAPVAPHVATVRVEPDRSVFQDGAATSVINAFAQDVLVVEGGGWDPAVAVIRVGGRPLTVSSATLTELRAAVPLDLINGEITVVSGSLASTSAHPVELHYLGAGHLQAPRFINQLEPAIVITSVAGPGAGNSPAGVITATFGFGAQESQLGPERFLSEITVNNGESAILPTTTDVLSSSVWGNYRVDLQGTLTPENSFVLALTPHGLALAAEDLETQPIPPPAGMVFTRMMRHVSPDCQPYAYDPTGCQWGAVSAVAVAEYLTVDGGMPDPDAGTPPRSVLLQLTEEHGFALVNEDGESTPAVLASGDSLIRASGVVPRAMDPLNLTDRDALTTLSCRDEANRTWVDIRRSGVRLEQLLAVASTVEHWPIPEPPSESSCDTGSDCAARLQCAEDPACEALLTCAHDPHCLQQFRCLFQPESDPTCAAVLGCSSPDGCQFEMGCSTGLCSQARPCVDDPACWQEFQDWQSCVDGYGEGVCAGMPCAHNTACASTILCRDNPSCAFVMDCLTHPACALAAANAYFVSDGTALCELDPECAGNARCALDPPACQRAAACAQQLCSLPPARTVGLHPLAPGQALLDVPGHLCTVDLGHNRLEGMDVSPLTAAALPSEHAADTHVLWVPTSAAGSQQVWSLRPYASGSAVTVADARAPYSHLEPDGLLNRVYASARTGSQIDILDADARRLDGVSVLGVPLNVIPLDNVGEASRESLILFLYPAITVLTDATGVKKAANVLKVESNPDPSNRGALLFYDETPGKGLQSVWFVMDKPDPAASSNPDYNFASRVMFVDAPRGSSTAYGSHVFADLALPKDSLGGTAPLAAVPVAVTSDKLVLLMRFRSGALSGVSNFTDLPCLAQCDSYDAYACEWLAYIPRGADGRAANAAGQPVVGRVTPTFVPGSCDVVGGMESRAYDSSARRAYLHVNTLHAETGDFQSALRILDLPAGGTPVLSTTTLPDAFPLVALPTGGVAGDFLVSHDGGNAQWELAFLAPGQPLEPTGLVLGLGVGLAVSPDGRRIYAGGDGTIMEVAVDDNPEQPGKHRTHIASLIPVQGAPNRIHADIRGERLVYLDDAKKVVGLLK